MIRCAVVVPSHNRPSQLARCLDALVRQDIEDYEIIVVDDGSAQPLNEVCVKYTDRVRCVRQPNAGPAAARNRGTAEATAEFVAFTDDDCAPRPGWLRGLRDVYAGKKIRLVGGRVENGLPQNPYASVSQELCDYLYDYFGAQDGTMPFFMSNNMGCSREEFARIGGFDETFPIAASEDREFGIRWRERGGDLIYAKDAVVDHFHAMSFASFWRQHSNYGAGAHHLHQVLDARGAKRPRREHLKFYRDLVVRPLRRDGLPGLVKATLMGLTQVAMVNGYGRAARRVRDR